MADFQKSIELLRQRLASISKEEFQKDWDELSSRQYGDMTVEDFLSVFNHEKSNDLPIVVSKDEQVWINHDAQGDAALPQESNEIKHGVFLSLKELKEFKYSLSKTSIASIAKELGMEEQKVRAFFKAKKNANSLASRVQPEVKGSTIEIDDHTIIELAKKIIEESHQRVPGAS